MGATMRRKRGDLEYAIAEGATIVRVGSAIFGERDFK